MHLRTEIVAKIAVYLFRWMIFMSFEQGKLYRYLNSDGWNRTIFSTNKLNVTDVIDLRNKTIGEVERDSIILILEALAQTAALLTFGKDAVDDSVYFFVGIDNARFKRPVTPGDQLILNASIERFKGGIWKFKTFATVNDVVVTEADLMCTIRKKGA